MAQEFALCLFESDAMWRVYCRSMFVRVGKMASFLVGAIILVLAAAGGVYLHVDRADPVIEGKRMSVRALDLTRENYGRDSYGVKREYMRVFETDREAAINALMKVVNCQRSRGRGPWFWLTGFLPKEMATALRPKPISMSNRWAAMLALSNLARQKADPRIPAFFLECIKDQSTNYNDKVVRKIAAYEAGPWLDPEHPEVMVEILRLALRDRAPEVTCDACRRIAASAKDPETKYGAAVWKLLPEVRKIDKDLIPEAVRAVAVLSSNGRAIAAQDGTQR
jgi:hypothetical protein